MENIDLKKSPKHLHHNERQIEDKEKKWKISKNIKERLKKAIKIIINNKEKYNEYQRNYQRLIYYPNKRQEELNNKFFEKETKLYFQ